MRPTADQVLRAPLGDLPAQRRPAAEVARSHGAGGELVRSESAPPPPPAMPGSTSPVRGSVDFKALALKAPPQDFTVTTTFPALPINGQEVRFEGLVTLDPGRIVPGPILSSKIEFVVPPGKIFIARRLAWEPSTILALGQTLSLDPNNISAISPFYVSWQIQGLTQFGYDRVYRQIADFKVYAIAGEGETHSITATTNEPDYTGPDVTIPGNGYRPQITVTLIGDLLDSRGREKQYEPANIGRG